MQLYIKNMVCSRCKMVVQNILEKQGYAPLHIELGQVELSEEPDKDALHQLNTALQEVGFELIDDRKHRLIERIKNTIVEYVHHSANNAFKGNLSDLIVSRLHHDYAYLSNLFSEAEGTTIEKYYISQRIERVKELLVYGELTLSEIAYSMGYSSAAHLSAQFKKVTGFNPSYFRQLKDKKRKNLEDL